MNKRDLRWVIECRAWSGGRWRAFGYCRTKKQAMAKRALNVAYFEFRVRRNVGEKWR